MTEDPRRAGAPEGNQNAAKDDDEKLTSFFRIRCLDAEAAAYKKAAGAEKLSRWMRRHLNKAAGLPPP